MISSISVSNESIPVSGVSSSSGVISSVVSSVSSDPVGSPLFVVSSVSESVVSMESSPVS